MSAQPTFREALGFRLHVFSPAGGRPDGFAIGVAVLAFAALQWLKAGIVPVVLTSGAVGLAWHLAQ